jgi:alpha-galactosidase
MTICTRTLTRVAPDLKVIGCCHEVFGTQHVLADLARTYLQLDQVPTRDEIEVNVLGINHFTWIDRATYKGHDLLAIVREHMRKPGVLRPYTREEVEASGNWFVDSLQIKFELFRRFGILAAAGDRHLCEFVAGFTRSPEELFRWGVIRTPISYRLERWSTAPGRMDDLMAGRIPLSLGSSGEEAVRQVRALVGLGDFVTNVNTPNRGQIANLPLDVVVETNAHFSRDRVQPLVAGDLPAGVHALVSRHVANQEMIIEAALKRDRDLAFQAVFNDPTTNLPIDKAWEMFCEIGVPAEFWDTPIA